MEKVCGEMQFSIFEFYELTPRQFQNLFNGYADKEEQERKERWYQVRWKAYWSAVGHLKKNTTPEKLLQFPWEKEVQESAGMPTDEEIEESKQFWVDYDAKHKKD